MTYPTDTVKFTVTYLKDGIFKQDVFNSFASAAGCADALNGITRYLNVSFSSQDSSISGSLYKYSRLDNQRSVCNQYLLNQLLKRSK